MTPEEAKLLLQENFSLLQFEHPRIGEAIKVAIEVLSEPSVYADVDEAAWKYGIDNQMGIATQSEKVNAFKAGVQWQKEHVDKEAIKLAEDHAYFAGSENTREKLIEKAYKWWEDKFTYPAMTSDEIEYYKSKFEDFRKVMEE